MSPAHRDPDGSPSVEPTHERLVERLIREAQERGDFDALPGHGTPLPPPDDLYAGEMAMAFTMLRNAGAAPPWIEADKDVRRVLAERDRLLERARRAGPLELSSLERAMADVVRAHERAVERLNAVAPTPRQHRRPLRLDEELASLHEALDS